MSLVKVEIVKGLQGIREFVKLPWTLDAYKSDPNWVPPLKLENHQRLSKRFNPFFKNARATYFIARRNGKAVGRISAHESFNFNKFHNSK